MAVQSVPSTNSSNVMSAGSAPWTAPIDATRMLTSASLGFIDAKRYAASMPSQANSRPNSRVGDTPERHERFPTFGVFNSPPNGAGTGGGGTANGSFPAETCPRLPSNPEGTPVFPAGLHASNRDPERPPLRRQGGRGRR